VTGNSDLRELYQEVILDHSKRPRNFGRLEGATHHADGDNPLCGDRIHLELEMAGDRVKDVRFEGQGCAISTASASLMTEALKGLTRDQADALFHKMHETCTGQREAKAAAETKMPDADVDIGKLAVFEGVRQYPLRVKCATLAWHTLRNALAGEHVPAKTE
jgi:nitrogen fixation NifU-like protein